MKFEKEWGFNSAAWVAVLLLVLYHCTAFRGRSVRTSFACKYLKYLTHYKYQARAELLLLRALRAS